MLPVNINKSLVLSAQASKGLLRELISSTYTPCLGLSDISMDLWGDKNQVCAEKDHLQSDGFKFFVILTAKAVKAIRGVWFNENS